MDAARGVALFGMMATHLVPRFGPDGGLTMAYTVADGRASALFAVIGGMSLALADGGSRASHLRRPFHVLLLRTAIRASIIGTLGLLLALAGPPILIILTYYAVLFVLVTPLLRLPVPVLAGAAVAWAVVGPLLSHAIRETYDLAVVFDQPSFALLVADPAGLLRQLVLTGTYPAGTWLAYALAGAALGRSVLTRSRLAWIGGIALTLTITAAATSDALLRTGMATVIQSGGGNPNGPFYGTTPTTTWWWLAIDRPHSGTPPDLLATMGTAVLVISVALLLFGTRARAALMWLALTGSMTLTLYTTHVLAAAAGLPTGMSGRDMWLVHVVLGIAFSLVWRSTFRRGPLEAVVAAAVNRATPTAVRDSATP